MQRNRAARTILSFVTTSFLLIALVASARVEAQIAGTDGPTSGASTTEPDVLYSTDVTGGDNWLQRTINFPTSEQIELTEDLLTSTIWLADPERDIWARFAFYKDGIVLGGFAGSGEQFRAAYRIEDSHVVVEPIRVSDFFNQSYGIDASSFRIELDRTRRTLSYTNALRSDALPWDLVPAGSEPAVGAHVVVDGVEVIKAERQVVVARNLSFRHGPGTDHPRFENMYAEYWHLFGDVAPDRVPDYFIPGHTLSVRAETVESQTIAGYTSPWLLVGFEGEAAVIPGWVFAAHTVPLDSPEGRELREQFHRDLENLARELRSGEAESFEWESLE